MTQESLRQTGGCSHLPVSFAFIRHLASAAPPVGHTQQHRKGPPGLFVVTNQRRSPGLTMSRIIPVPRRLPVSNPGFVPDGQSPVPTSMPLLQSLGEESLQCRGLSANSYIPSVTLDPGARLPVLLIHRSESVMQKTKPASAGKQNNRHGRKLLTPDAVALMKKAADVLTIGRGMIHITLVLAYALPWSSRWRYWLVRRSPTPVHYSTENGVITRIVPTDEPGWSQNDAIDLVPRPARILLWISCTSGSRRRRSVRTTPPKAIPATLGTGKFQHPLHTR